ncbi:hypothetical protein CYMTET_49875 [Cymbomonas tetramitiformis]|uniref:EF-hand domain-containing protein n=1 Tax=Cymbomonas tetramitiformis TaxID=36881 RepID=A0AAE0BQZ5_9CHLO|nr:hypothetical protein CYMTET_49875 [Cymbomonas tetramitiformis]
MQRYASSIQKCDVRMEPWVARGSMPNRRPGSAYPNQSYGSTRWLHVAQEFGYAPHGRYKCLPCSSPFHNNLRMIFSINISLVLICVTIQSNLKRSMDGGQPVHSLMIKVLINYFQTAVPVAGLFEWPEMVWELFLLQEKASDSSQESGDISGVFSVDCSLESTPGLARVYKKILVTLVIPIFHFGLITAFWVFKVWAWEQLTIKGNAGWLERFRKYLGNDEMTDLMDMQGKAKYLKNRIIVTAVIVLFFTWPSISSVILEIFACVEVDTGNVDPLPELYSQWSVAQGLYFSMDMQQKCYEGQHETWVLALGVPGIFLVALGIPAGTFALLYYNHADLSNFEFKSLFGFLYDGYEDQFFYFESVVMGRKLMILAIMYLLDSSEDVQALSMFTVVLFTLILHIWTLPWINNNIDKLEYRSHLVVTSTLLVGLFITTQALDEYLLLALVFIILVINCVFCINAGIFITAEMIILEIRRMDADGDGNVDTAEIEAYVDSVLPSFLGSFRDKVVKIINDMIETVEGLRKMKNKKKQGSNWDKVEVKKGMGVVLKCKEAAVEELVKVGATKFMKTLKKDPSLDGTADIFVDIPVQEVDMANAVPLCFKSASRAMEQTMQPAIEDSADSEGSEEWESLSERQHIRNCTEAAQPVFPRNFMC